MTCLFVWRADHPTIYPFDGWTFWLFEYPIVRWIRQKLVWSFNYLKMWLFNLFSILRVDRWITGSLDDWISGSFKHSLILLSKYLVFNSSMIQSFSHSIIWSFDHSTICAFNLPVFRSFIIHHSFIHFFNPRNVWPSQFITAWTFDPLNMLGVDNLNIWPSKTAKICIFAHPKMLKLVSRTFEHLNLQTLTIWICGQLITQVSYYFIIWWFDVLGICQFNHIIISWRNY